MTTALPSVIVRRESSLAPRIVIALADPTEEEETKEISCCRALYALTCPLDAAMHKAAATIVVMKVFIVCRLRIGSTERLVLLLFADIEIVCSCDKVF